MVKGAWSEVNGSWLRVRGIGVMVHILRSRVQGTGYGVWGLWSKEYMVSGLAFRVKDSEFTV
jgi:hypothetical protein